jgi:hypothetical protein
MWVSYAGAGAGAGMGIAAIRSVAVRQAQKKIREKKNILDFG